MDDCKPFRWDLSKREQLPKVPPLTVDPQWLQFERELRLCAARVVAAAGDTDWVFVGRSPEHLFDYLSGAFESMPDAPSLTHMQFSMRWGSHEEIARRNPLAFTALGSYFAGERLDPDAIASFGKAVTFIDVVSTGRTFRNLVGCLKLWCGWHKADWNAVQRRIRFVGLTTREKASPKTWRWQQHQDWLANLPDARVKNVSAPYWVIQAMAVGLEKLTPSHTSDRWALVGGGGPHRDARSIKALAIARRLYGLGRAAEGRLALAADLARLREMRDPWLRSVVLRLRQRSRHVR